MCEYMRSDRIRNKVIREKVEVALIEDKMRETRLRWFGHIKRRSENRPVRKCERINLRECRRGSGRPKKSWKEVIKGGLNFVGLDEDMDHNRSLWRSRIKITNNR